MIRLMIFAGLVSLQLTLLILGRAGINQAGVWLLSLLVFAAISMLVVESSLFVLQKNKTLHMYLRPQLYHHPFSEREFPPRADSKLNYKATVVRGYLKMQQTGMVVLTLCRNVAKYLPLFISSMEEYASHCKWCRIILLENDSTDYTREIIEAWSLKNPNVFLVDVPNKGKLGLGHSRSGGAHHLVRMVILRNMLLQWWRSQHWYTCDDKTLVTVVDGDMHAAPSLDGIAHSIGYEEPWDSISAYPLSGGVATLGRLHFSPGDSFSTPATLDRPQKGLWSFLGEWYQFYHQWNYSGKVRGDQPFSVLSAFGGLSLYKSTSLDGSEYAVQGTKSEHQVLQEMMALVGHGRHLINPSMILLQGVQGPEDLLLH